MAIAGYNAGLKPPRKTFIALALNEAIANNKVMFSLTNDAASGVLVELQRVWIVNSRTTAVTGVVSDFRFRRLTSHSGGTLLTPESYDSSDTLNSGITARSNSTPTGLSSTDLFRAQWSSDEWGTGTTDVEAADHVIQQCTPLWKAEKEKGIRLRENEGFAIYHVVNSAKGNFDIICEFTEEPL